MIELERKTKLIIGGSILGVVVLVGGIWSYASWRGSEPPVPKSLAQAADVLTSSRFTRLSNEKQYAYYFRVKHMLGDATREQRDRFHGQLGDRSFRMEELELYLAVKAVEYAQAANEADQQKVLNQVLTRLPRRRNPNRKLSFEEIEAREAFIERIQERAEKDDPVYAEHVEALFLAVTQAREAEAREARRAGR